MSRSTIARDEFNSDTQGGRMSAFFPLSAHDEAEVMGMRPALMDICEHFAEFGFHDFRCADCDCAVNEGWKHAYCPSKGFPSICKGCQFSQDGFLEGSS